MGGCVGDGIRDCVAACTVSLVRGGIDDCVGAYVVALAGGSVGALCWSLCGISSPTSARRTSTSSKVRR